MWWVVEVSDGFLAHAQGHTHIHTYTHIHNQHVQKIRPKAMNPIRICLLLMVGPLEALPPKPA